MNTRDWDWLHGTAWMCSTSISCCLQNKGSRSHNPNALLILMQITVVHWSPLWWGRPHLHARHAVLLSPLRSSCTGGGTEALMHKGFKCVYPAGVKLKLQRISLFSGNYNYYGTLYSAHKPSLTPRVPTRVNDTSWSAYSYVMPPSSKVVAQPSTLCSSILECLPPTLKFIFHPDHPSPVLCNKPHLIVANPEALELLNIQYPALLAMQYACLA